MNRATLLGNLAKDVELKSTPSGKSVAQCAIATNKVWRDESGQQQKRVEFHNLVIWGKAAETFAKYLKKGSKILVEGEIQTRNWTGKDGVKRYTTEIVVNNFVFLSSVNSPAVEKPAEQPKPIETKEEAVDFPETVGGEDEIRIEDIPF